MQHEMISKKTVVYNCLKYGTEQKITFVVDGLEIDEVTPSIDLNYALIKKKLKISEKSNGRIMDRYLKVAFKPFG